MFCLIAQMIYCGGITWDLSPRDKAPAQYAAVSVFPHVAALCEHFEIGLFCLHLVLISRIYKHQQTFAIASSYAGRHHAICVRHPWRIRSHLSSI